MNRLVPIKKRFRAIAGFFSAFDVEGCSADTQKKKCMKRIRVTSQITIGRSLDSLPSIKLGQEGRLALLFYFRTQ